MKCNGNYDGRPEQDMEESVGGIPVENLKKQTETSVMTEERIGYLSNVERNR
jgi:hypothetical protein